MKKIAYVLFVLVTVNFIGCSSTDEGTDPEKMEVQKEEEKEEPEVPEEPEEVDEPSGADLLYNGTALLATEDTRFPYIFFNTEGAETAAIDENADGILDKIILTDDDLETVIEMNIETGLPSRMYTSEGILVIYNFKDNNTKMDVAVVREGEEVTYISDVDVSDFGIASKTAASGKSVACEPLKPTLVTMANGYKWALGGWCKIKQNNSVRYQALNLTARECRDIYREMFPCCTISTYEDAYCNQIPNQTKVLGEIAKLVECGQGGTLQTCITNGLIRVQDIINGANTLKNEIGEELILQAENVIFDLVDSNPGGNAALVGTWFLEKQEELSGGIIDRTLINVEYCDDGEFDDDCFTITEATMEFKADGTLISILSETEKVKEGEVIVTNTIVEKEEGKWSYNEDTEELLIVLYSYEYLENGEVDESGSYGDGDVIPVVSLTVSATDLVIIFDSQDLDADGIVEESYTEFYTKG